MQTTYAKRLRQALEHAGISQAELARRIGLKNPQAVQYLAEEKNHARGSRHTSRFAEQLGVSGTWLETGAGAMLADASGARQPAAAYKINSAGALAKAIGRLDSDLQRALAQIVGALADSKSGRTVSLSAAEASAEALSRPRGRTRRTA